MKVYIISKWNTTREKIPPLTQRNQNQNQANRKVCFVLPTYSWTQDLPWSVVDISSNNLLEKSLVSFPQQVSTENTFFVQGGLCVCFPFSMLGFLSDLNLCRSLTCCHSL